MSEQDLLDDCRKDTSMSKHIRPSQYDETYDPTSLVRLLRRYGEIHALDDDYMSQLHFLGVKAAVALEQTQQNNRELNELLTIRTKQAAGSILKQGRIEQLEATLMKAIKAVDQFEVATAVASDIYPQSERDVDREQLIAGDTGT